MSKKNLDSEGRFRSKTVAFRLSPQEAEELDLMWRISGYRIKQDYIRDCLFRRKVEAKGNPHMLISMRRTLKEIKEEVESDRYEKETENVLITRLDRMIEILEAF